jgi:hypothetical protein
VALGTEVNDTKFININSLSTLLQLTVEVPQQGTGRNPQGRTPYV